MQRVDIYANCNKCQKSHMLTEGDCFPRWLIFTDDTGEDGYLVAARSRREAAELYVNGCDEEYKLIGRSVEIVVGDMNGMDREAFIVRADYHVEYTAEPAIKI